MKPVRFWATLFLLSVLGPWTSGVAEPIDPLLGQAIESPTRSPKFVARDGARHPAEELAFFGIRADQTVVEIWPGGGYWTEILAPYLRDHGKLYAATTGSSTESSTLRAKFDAAPALYDKVTLTVFGQAASDIAPAGTADLIVTFRNLHNWMKAGSAEAAFATFRRALKPGGILGLEDHRGRTDTPQDPLAEDGYVREDYAIALARNAGFEFVGRSEINANPKDTKDWPKGVWTLPPTLTLGEVDRAKYEAVGEADSFVLKFRKPAP
jgi:predicted methyltransferase